ncbi:hypothetical protein GGI35DRAFT_463523 [Trichoderma velutinum]
MADPYMRKTHYSGCPERFTGNIPRCPRLLPADNDPELVPPISTLEPLSLPASPFPFSLVDDENDRSLRLAAYHNHVGPKTRGRPRRQASRSVSSRRNLKTAAAPPSVSGTRKPRICNRPRQPRLIYNILSPHLEADGCAADTVFGDPVPAGQISNNALQGIRQRSRSYHTGGTAMIRDTGLFRSWKPTMPVKFYPLGIVAMKTLLAHERTCGICYYDYGTGSEDGVVEIPVQLSQCTHVFGHQCIKRWYERSNTCPLCRK